MNKASELTTQIGKKLKEIRKAKKITQMDLAETADVHFTYYSQIERGLRRDVSVRILKRIVDALEVSFNDIIDSNISDKPSEK